MFENTSPQFAMMVSLLRASITDAAEGPEYVLTAIHTAIQEAGFTPVWNTLETGELTFGFGRVLDDGTRQFVPFALIDPDNTRETLRKHEDHVAKMQKEEEDAELSAYEVLMELHGITPEMLGERMPNREDCNCPGHRIIRKARENQGDADPRLS